MKENPGLINDNLLDTRVNQHTPIEMNSFIKDFVEKVLLVKSTKTSRAHSENWEIYKFRSDDKIVWMCVTLKR